MIPDTPSTQSVVVYAVSELNQMVACLLSDCFPLLKVVGEVSNFSCPRSGHWYFSLKDSKAQVRCVFFHGQHRAENLNLADGAQIIVHARLRLYETRGDFQLVVEAIEAVGDGVLRQKYDALKLKLSQEGLFDTNRKKPLPTFVNKLGIITSSTGAAIRDVLAILQRRFPAIEVIIYPTLVQGEAAAENIAQQIEIANIRQECQVLLVTRGGGSLEDLWCFNEEVVARAIAASQLPIISAVGHEIDITIADFVADIRAATPSAAAELVSPDQIIWKQQLEQLEKRFLRSMINCLEQYKQRIAHLQRCLRHPGQRLQNYWQLADDLERRLQQAWQKQLENKKQRLATLSRALDAVNPLATLVRGYALIKKDSDGSIIQDAEQTNIGDSITAQLAKGKLLCIVQNRIIE